MMINLMEALKMKLRLRVMIIGLCIGLMAGSAAAADYNNWLKLVPGKLGGMAKSGTPDGMNMNMNGQAWSSLQQKYENKSKYVNLIIVSGLVAPQVQTFQMMTQMQMETQEQVIKTLTISGYKAIYQLDKNEKNGSLMISVSPETVVVLESSPVNNEKQMVDMAKDVPLAKIASAAK